MRFLGYVVTGAAVLLAACGGGDQAAKTTDAPAADMPAAGSPGMTGSETAGAAQAITGTIHEVKMLINANQQYVYEPAEITVKQGDGIKFAMVSGGPHNVAFDATLLPADVKSQLMANMPNQAAELMGPMMLTEGEDYTISFAGVAPGTYEYFCTPHLAMGMRGKVTVTQ